MINTRKTAAVLALVFVATSLAPYGWAQKKDKEKKVQPSILMAVPLGTAPGRTEKIALRGLSLDKVTAVHLQETPLKARIVSKGKVAAPDKMPTKEGDSQVVIEVTVPTDYKGASLSVVVETPDGKAPPHQLLIEGNSPLIQQKEPNEGFSSAQPVQVPLAIDGLIDRPQDVDVFSFAGKAGERLAIDVLARRHGSVLDPILTLYSQDGQQIGVSDGTGGSVDARLQVTLPRSGTYFLTLIDAHDRGGPTHPYRLVIRRVK